MHDDNCDYSKRKQSYPPAPAADPKAPTWREVVQFNHFDEYPVDRYDDAMGRHWYLLTWDGVQFWCWYLPSSEAGKAVAAENTGTKRISGKLFAVKFEPWPQIKNVKFIKEAE